MGKLLKRVVSSKLLKRAVSRTKTTGMEKNFFYSKKHTQRARRFRQRSSKGTRHPLGTRYPLGTRQRERNFIRRPSVRLEAAHGVMVRFQNLRLGISVLPSRTTCRHPNLETQATFCPFHLRLCIRQEYLQCIIRPLVRVRMWYHSCPKLFTPCRALPHPNPTHIFRRPCPLMQCTMP